MYIYIYVIATLSGVFVKIGEVGFLKFFPKDRVLMLNSNTPHTDRDNNPPDINDLESLPRRNLFEIASGSFQRMHGIRRTWTKPQLVQYISANWASINRDFGRMYGSRTPFQRPQLEPWNHNIPKMVLLMMLRLVSRLQSLLRMF